MVPSGEKVSVAGPEALSVTATPVSLSVAVTSRAPVIFITVEPSAAVEMVPYSLLTGNVRWTGKLQTPTGRSKGAAARKVR